MYVPYPNGAWYFVTEVGAQSLGSQYGSLYALAVRPGDVAAAVPEPQTYALMLLGIAALMLAVRRRAR